MRLNKNRMSGEGKIELQIAPLIDVVFLLLIYFMVTASLIKKEGDISFLLPATVSQPPVNIPLEVLIEIDGDGRVHSEGLSFAPDDKLLNGLSGQLLGRKRIAQTQGAPFSVNLIPDGEALHDRVIDVMDAAAAAGVKNLTFSKSL